MMKRYYSDSMKSRRAAELYSRERHDWSVLRNKRVLVAGAGGLGTFIVAVLSGTGVGEIVVVDRDVVELSNLNRQFLYSVNDLGKPKAKVLEERLRGRPAKISGMVSDAIDVDLRGFDAVVDALDSKGEKQRLMKKALELEVPYVFASVGEAKGIVSVPTNPFEWKARTASKVSAPEVAVIGGIASEQAISILEGKKPPLLNKMLYVDLDSLSFYVVEL